MPVKNQTLSEKIFTLVSIFLLIILSVVMMYPFYYLLVYSFNEPMDAMRGGIYIWPRKFSTIAYRTVFQTRNIGQAAWMSFLRTFLGTSVSLFCTAMLSYVLSRKHLVLRKFFNKYFIITMYVSGGLIPTYMVIRSLRLLNTFWVYIIPGLINVFYMILIRTYMEGIPDSLSESAEIDGANDWVIFIKIMLPLCVPILAVIAIFTAVGHWNSWFDNFIYTSRKSELTTLQLLLVNMLKQHAVTRSSDLLRPDQRTMAITQESIRAAITMIVTIPIILVYPFFQRHFTMGIMLGSIKG